MNKPLISIIIPVYNTKQYLEKCINSVINQTYKNLEIILINDTSSEGTEEICKHFQQLDNRIKLINVSNLEVGEVRNVGIRNATGDYFGFVDSDDYIYDDMFETLLDNLVQLNADISIIGFAREENGIIEPSVFTNTIEVLDKETALEELLKDKKIQSFMWNKLFKRNLWDSIFFDAQRVFEDIDVSYKLFERSNKVVIIDSLKYIYVQRNTSIMHEHNSRFILDRLHVIIDRYNYFVNSNNQKFQFVNKYALAVNMIVMYRKIILEEYYDILDDFMKYYQLFLDIINEYQFEIRKILTPNQNLVLDFMLEDLSTAPEKIKNTKDIDK